MWSFERRQEVRGPAAHEFGDAVADEEFPAVGRGIHAADEPLLVADDDAGARGEERLARGLARLSAFRRWSCQRVHQALPLPDSPSFGGRYCASNNRTPASFEMDRWEPPGVRGWELNQQR